MALGGNGERHGVVLTRNRYFNPAWLLDNDIIKMNGIINTHVVRLSAEEVVQAIDGEREFTRLKNTELDLTTLNIKTVLVDPPRAGCGPDVSKMLQRFDNIVYISCNAETLAEDMLILSKTHDMKRFAVFDQFPYTPHLECAAYLVKKKS